MKNLCLFTLTIYIFISILLNSAFAATQDNRLKEDKAQVTNWNNFISELYQLHLDMTQRFPVSTSEITGGYGGTHANKYFYRETSYFNRANKRLISKIQRETASPDTIHSIEVFLYDAQGRVKTDFYARYLPYFRNAPVQTLINLHNYSDELHAFRQFDASGELIYETCRGKYFNETINLHLDDEEIFDFRNNNSDEMMNEVYATCFLNVPHTATDYLHPARFIPEKNKITDADRTIDFHLATLNKKIKQHPQDAHLYIERGNLFFTLHDFEKSITDFNTALSIDEALSQAYFGRGMALARNGQISAGIDDLTIFIKRNPRDSRAYTKRGVRYIWAGKLDKAQQDLIMAIKLDNSNAEAHDDLGVLYAQQMNFDSALKHFNFAIHYEPTYQKAYHNSAMVYVLTGEQQKALTAVNKSLSFDSNSRSSLMLKSEILKAMGKDKEAASIMKKAEFLPEGNWSERFQTQ